MAGASPILRRALTREIDGPKIILLLRVMVFFFFFFSFLFPFFLYFLKHKHKFANIDYVVSLIRDRDLPIPTIALGNHLVTTEEIILKKDKENMLKNFK